MALIYVRNKYSADGLRGLVERNGGGDREEASRKALSEIGMELKAAYFTTASGSAVLIVEGDPEKLTVLEVWAMSTGAFQSVEAEVLIPLNSISEAAKTVGEVYGKYDAPNQDEIDRMLLEE